LTYRRLLIPLDRLVVRDITPLMRRDARLLAANLKIAGILNPPSAIGPQEVPTGSAGLPPLEVFLGRRRVLAARLLVRDAGLREWDHLWCHVYDLPDEPALARRLRALLTLSENGCRSPAWVEEARRLVEFLDHPVPLTDREIWTSLGIPPAEAKARLKLARLPRPILEQVFSGGITSQSLLHRIARLTPDQQQALAARANVGERITPLLVDQALRGQIASGLANPVLQESLGKGWELDQPPSVPARSVGPTGRRAAAPATGAAAGSPSLSPPPSTPPIAGPVSQAGGQGETSAAPAIAHALAVLRGLLPMLAGDPRLTQAHLLTEALLGELEPEAQRRPTDGAAA
jgi:ParB-like chromosome segregation protein Spo0J